MRARDERGQASVLIVGFAAVLAMTVALVVNSSAAYLARQGLDGLADGAALRGADLGATGSQVYSGGVPDELLGLTLGQARTGVRDYLVASNAYQRFPGLSWTVRINATTNRIEVVLDAPMELPLSIPGSPERASVGATGSAVVGVDP